MEERSMAFPHAVINGCSRILLVSDHENEQPPLKTDEQENATKNHEHNQQFSTVVDSEAFFEGKMAEIDKEANRLYNICDSDQRGFITTEDLKKLDGLVEHTQFEQLFQQQAGEHHSNLVNQTDFLDALRHFLKIRLIEHSGDEIIAPEPRRRLSSLFKNCEQKKMNDGTFNTISLNSIDEPPDPSPIRTNFTGVPARTKISDGLNNSELKQHQQNEESTMTEVANLSQSKEPRENGSVINHERQSSSSTNVKDSACSGSGSKVPNGQAILPLNTSIPCVKRPSDVGVCRQHLSTGCEPSNRARKRSPDIKNRGKTRSGGTLDVNLANRLFKVVFVGDSAVGKSCFLQRFCHDRFKPVFNATIGVDFTIREIEVEPGKSVCIQLWDTAGQERFRSITKQYFRKADGVVLMYDVSSEESFLNVRAWVESIRNGVDDGCVLCLVGNKIDLYPNEEDRTISYKHGEELAKEFDMLYFESSAFTGRGTREAMKILAQGLKKREEEIYEEVMRLEMLHKTRNDRWCCF